MEPYQNLGTDETATENVVIVVRDVKYSVADPGEDESKLQAFADHVAFCIDSKSPIKS